MHCLDSCNPRVFAPLSTSPWDVSVQPHSRRQGVQRRIVKITEWIHGHPGHWVMLSFLARPRRPTASFSPNSTCICNPILCQSLVVLIDVSKWKGPETEALYQGLAGRCWRKLYWLRADLVQDRTCKFYVISVYIHPAPVEALNWRTPRLPICSSILVCFSIDRPFHLSLLICQGQVFEL